MTDKWTTYITERPLDLDLVQRAVGDPRHGAAVVFSGVVRNHDSGNEVASLEYFAHPDAHVYLDRCCARMSREFGLPVAAGHRVGSLVVGDVALVAAVAAPHRRQAFDICSVVVERIKIEVPIWKHQTFVGGQSEWVGM
ncbi:MAG: molybdenum cofactor biosynthesis protein MoaE [Pseudonocardia sp.]|nr:MAG: molybdenum cofactor biosynthesis protein MoaE [Pseudonocardia sp.]